MSKISISSLAPNSNVDAIKLIHQVTGLSIASAKKRLEEGTKGFFYTAELFLNDHTEKDKEISTLLEGFHKLGIELFILEIPFDLEWAAVKDFEKYRISEKELENILQEARGRYS